MKTKNLARQRKSFSEENAPTRPLPRASSSVSWRPGRRLTSPRRSSTPGSRSGWSALKSHHAAPAAGSRWTHANDPCIAAIGRAGYERYSERARWPAARRCWTRTRKLARPTCIRLQAEHPASGFRARSRLSPRAALDRVGIGDQAGVRPQGSDDRYRLEPSRLKVLAPQGRWPDRAPVRLLISRRGGFSRKGTGFWLPVRLPMPGWVVGPRARLVGDPRCGPL